MQTATARDHYEKRAKEGYGLMYPDGQVIRGYENFLKQRMAPVEGKKMFDFGCWNGTHANYFYSKGFRVSGDDIVEGVVNSAKGAVPTCSENFHTISDQSSLTEIFHDKFDLIFSNQTLYFLDNQTLAKRLDEFERLLVDSGIVFFTMMSRSNYFSSYCTGVGSNGLEKIIFPQNHRFFGKEPEVRFIENFHHLRSVFCRFECLTSGLYDVSFSEGESAEHYIFIGKKR